MSEATGERSVAKQLCRAWEELLDRGGLSEELEYRILKMLERMIPIANKVFLKTAKGQIVLHQCLQKTVLLQEELYENRENAFLLLTDLERTFDDLLKTAYKFRVRTG
jgi:hypothetical protein